MEVFILILNYIWKVMNIKYQFNGYSISYFNMIAFSVILGLTFRIIFKGGGSNSDK